MIIKNNNCKLDGDLNLLKTRLLSLVFAFASISAFGQNVLDAPLKNITAEKSFTSLLLQLENEHPVRFFYLDSWLENFKVNPSFNGRTFRAVLEELFRESEMSYTVLSDYAIVFIKDPSNVLERESILRKASAQRKYIQRLVLGEPTSFTPGTKMKLKGKLTNETNGAVLEGAVISVNEKPLTETNALGSYELVLNPGEHVITFHYPNFAGKVVDLGIYKDGVLDIILEEVPVMLEEVVVADEAILNNRMSVSSLKIKDLKRAPSFLGEIDVIKQIQNQPGVTTVGEVASGFNVRGGGVDQNLVQYDGVPILNTAHALGFFSSFNADAVQQVSFYRGGIPAEFGGRVSSVLNITSREGTYDKWTGSGGIGIISSHLTLGGPIRRDTTSVIASFRSSYSNWMLATIRSDYTDLSKSAMNFYDGSFKLSHKFTNRTKLVLSGYASHDDFSLASDTVFGWNNLAASIKLDHSFNDRLSSTFALAFGQYAYSLQEPDPENAFELQYKVTYPSLKMDFSYSGDHELSFGFHNTFYTFSPGEMAPSSQQSNARPIKIADEKSLETGFYFSDAFYLRDKFFIEAGLRYSIFTRIGATTVYNYASGAPLESRNIVDSTQYSNGDVVKMYHGLEPRLSLRYTLTENSSVKLGYNRIFQYLHLVTNTAAVTPVDIWQSSNTFFKPQIADQISVGYYRNQNDGMYEFFVEGFYKHMQNVLDFKDGASLILNNKLETALISGTGKAFGTEFSATKAKGRLTGNVNYTFSRSFRQVNGLFDSEKINDGRQYASNYDQPHVVNVSWRYGISRRFFFSGNFTYHTGRPMSLPTSTYTVDGYPVSEFSDRNKYRIPDYHRMDLAFVREGNHKRKKLWDGTFVFSFYNVYARKNAYSVFFKDDGNGVIRPYKLSVVGTIIPSVIYTFKF